ncbi:hypothetical protein [Streptomyces sp. NPDC102282]|uniref:hypothetical protein n=1 Tax=Streptomyces sp. NPDC102282 TaxID=3366154 RepID=UPI0038100860
MSWVTHQDAEGQPGLAAVDGQEEPAVDPTVVVDVPGLVAEHLQDSGDEAIRRFLEGGQTIRRGQGYSVRVPAPLSVHVAMIERSSTGLMQSPAGRKAHRIHSDRVTSVRLQD